MKENYHVDVELLWKKQTEFNETFQRILSKNEIASFGASGFSITSARQLLVGFSPPYLADISVMISSEPVPLAENFDDFLNIASRLTAITVKKSTFEEDLLALKNKGNLLYPIEYVKSGKSVIEEVEKRKNAFGIVDLAIYLEMLHRDPTMKIKRQNLFTKIQKGFGLIYPLGSDWGEPMAEFIHEKHFKENFQKVIARYINTEDYNFIEGLPDSDFQIALLTREKEIQQQHIYQEKQLRNMGTALLALTGIFLITILILYLRSKHLYRKIKQQQLSIERQNRELAMKNKNLEEFTFTNAHKLRGPVASILGLIQLYNHKDFAEKDQIIDLLKQSSSRLDTEVRAIRHRLKEEGWMNPREDDVIGRE